MEHARIEWNYSVNETLRRNGFNDKTLLFAANELKRLYDPFVPFLTGMTSKLVSTYVEGGRGVLHYLTPNAHYIYIGELMISPITGSAWASKGEKKVYAGSQLKYNKAYHPLATSKWDEAAKPVIIKPYTSAVQKYIERG